MVDILKGPSITKHQNPKKLMIMLHGYGDNATNFIQIANLIDQDDWGMKYVALNAPDTIQDYPMGHEWFQLYFNGNHIWISVTSPSAGKSTSNGRDKHTRVRQS